MEMILKIMGGALGVLVPHLFVYTINKGIGDSPFDEHRKVRLRRTIFSSVWGWAALVWIFSLTGIFSFHNGDVFPRFLFPLIIPVVIGIALLFTEDFRTILDHTPLSLLARVQTFRFAGFAFIIIAQMGILPTLFVSGGYGDIITGALALSSAILLSKQKKGGREVFLAFSAVGLLDLMNVAYLLLKYYPIWYSSEPSSAPAADFSLVMIPAIAAPVALLLHFYALRNFLLRKSEHLMPRVGIPLA
jgi:hypothetical protein